MPTRQVPAELLSALFEESEVGFAVLDRDLRYLGINETLAEMNGVSVQDSLGRTFEEVIPELAKTARPLFAQVFATGAPIRDLELRGATPAGEGVWLESVYPLRGADGEIEAVGVVVVDIAVRARTQAELDSVNTLLEEVLQQAPVGLAVFDAELRFTRVNDALAEINRRPAEEHIGKTAEGLLGPAGAPITELLRKVVATQRSIKDVEFHDPGDGEAPERFFLANYFPLPGGSVGSLVLDATAQVRELQRQREQAERAEHLRHFSSRLAESARADEIAQALAEDCCLAVGMERSLVSLVSDRDRAMGDEVRALEVAASVGYPEEAIASFRRVLIDAPFPGPESLRDGQSRWYESADDHEREYPDLAPLYRKAGNEAGAVIPLLNAGRPLGYLALAHPEPKSFSAAERTRALAIADQAAQALARAFLHEREHELAHALQDSLLPEPVGEHPQIEVSCCYLPAGTVARVGGDWFDVVDLPEREVLLIVGDIAGHGTKAAAEMAELSAVVRSQALAGAAPAECLDFLARYAAARPNFPFATVCCCRLAPGGELRWARAGHPPPLVAAAQGARYLEGGLGPAIGITGSGDPYEEASVQLGAEETVLLYTDGLIEQGRPGFDAGLASLAERIDSSSCRPAQLVKRVEAELVAEELEDDVALLAFALLGGSPRGGAA